MRRMPCWSARYGLRRRPRRGHRHGAAAAVDRPFKSATLGSRTPCNCPRRSPSPVRRSRPGGCRKGHTRSRGARARRPRPRDRRRGRAGPGTARPCGPVVHGGVQVVVVPLPRPRPDLAVGPTSRIALLPSARSSAPVGTPPSPSRSRRRSRPSAARRWVDVACSILPPSRSRPPCRSCGSGRAARSSAPRPRRSTASRQPPARVVGPPIGTSTAGSPSPWQSLLTEGQALVAAAALGQPSAMSRGCGRPGSRSLRLREGHSTLPSSLAATSW